MESYTTKDGFVTKYVHNDGSETAIKLANICDATIETFGLPIQPVERDKYVVFVSSSVGCPVKCKFCWLTIKKCPYIKLSINAIVDNVKEAILHQATINPQIQNKAIKISWMGMGDALYVPETIFMATTEILDWVFNNKLATCIDSIDIGTTMPPNDKFVPYLLGFDYSEYPYKRGLRVFYSLVSTRSDIRKKLMPNSPADGLTRFLNLKQLADKNIAFILHHLFLHGINDRESDIIDLIKLCNQPSLQDVELRILRFNDCSNKFFDESPHLQKIVNRLSTAIPNLKLQVSIGSEVKASCGQFLVSKF